MEKNVLIIGYLWPWCIQSGAARGQIFAKYLKEHGWNPIIITAPLKKGHPYTECEIVEVDHTNTIISLYERFTTRNNTDIDDVRRNSSSVNTRSQKIQRGTFLVKRYFKEIFFIPDSERGWGKKALQAAENIIAKRKIDAMISISPPHTAQIVAYKIKKKYDVPWIADFSHLWSYDPGYPYGFFRRSIDIKMEKKTISKADAITTVSDPLKEILEKLHHKKVYSIPHGFDLTLYLDYEPRLDDSLTITYTGTLHEKYRTPSNLFLALKELIDEGKIEPNSIKVHFFGDIPSWFEGEVCKYQLQNIVTHYGFLPQEQIIPILQKSQLLLFLMYTEQGTKGVISTKLFEYLAANRPILAINGEEDVVTGILKDTNAGVWAQDLNSMKDALLSYYREFNKNGYLHSTTRMEYLKKYTYSETVKKFAEILSEIT